jgi:epoxyqueuosine reductase QueG
MSMATGSDELARLISTTIHRLVTEAGTDTQYREPLIAVVSSSDPRFDELHHLVHPAHLLPQDLLPGARSVVSFFLPFAPWVVEANRQHREKVAREWAVAYVETNALIGHITDQLIEILRERGIRAAAEPATHNFDPETLVSRWSHKSVAVIAGLGSLGLHQMVITDAGCAGRFGSLVLDAELPANEIQPRERCLYFHNGSCLECVQRCPAAALDTSEALDKQLCWQKLLQVVQEFQQIGHADVCGKCATGPCAFESAVHNGTSFSTT